MKYLSKLAADFYSGYRFHYQKPSICPHCGIGTDAPITTTYHCDLNNQVLLLATARCTACSKSFFFACHKTEDSNAPAVCIYPSISYEPFHNENLEKISQRFIDIYNQAAKCEFDGNLDLAAIGYRTSLEVLVKDYAIQELSIPEEEASKKSLFEAIGEYLKQEDVVKTADVVRILGNDYTHYRRKYPEFDFSLLKYYMEIFIKQIEAAYMTKHPPVMRDH